MNTSIVSTHFPQFQQLEQLVLAMPMARTLGLAFRRITAGEVEQRTQHQHSPASLICLSIRYCFDSCLRPSHMGWSPI